jgi:hypothetical protein
MFKTLYKLTSTGAIQQWQIFVSVNGHYWTRYGQVDGAIVETNPTKCKRKNVGKINETTEEEQAILEATSKYEKKLKEQDEEWERCWSKTGKLAGLAAFSNTSPKDNLPNVLLREVRRDGGLAFELTVQQAAELAAG